MGLFQNFFRDSATSEDLVQEVFLRVHRAREKYRPEAKFKTWLYRIAVNVARNKRRSMSRRPEVSLPNTTDTGSQGLQAIALEKSGLMPSRIADSGELREQVRKAVMGLSERQRMAVLLSKFEGMSYADVGETMGLSESAVKSLLVRARENLRDQLARFESLDN